MTPVPEQQGRPRTNRGAPTAIMKRQNLRVNRDDLASPFDEGSAGQLRAHPATALANQLLTQVLAAEKVMG